MPPLAVEAALGKWLEECRVGATTFLRLLPDLGTGERELIVQALEQGITSVVLDDLAARRFARRLGLEPVGTVGLLLAGKKRGLVSTLRSNKPRIISASRRTDIPAFYGKWFMQRIQKGWAVSYNPFSRRAVQVSLLPSDVAAIVFWSKNFGPFLPHLTELAALSYKLVFLYTITGLPRVFEGKVPDAGAAVAAFKAISRMFSSKHIQWRYDPILLTNITDKEYHLRQFRDLCRRLEGYTTRCYTSFVNLYPKVQRRLEALKKGVKMLTVPEADQLELVNHLAEIAAGHGIELYSCCNDHLVGGRVKKAHCVDRDLLADLFDLDAGLYRVKSTRKQCGCCESIDIGMYDTCPNACIYCYANAGSKASKNYLNHDPDSPALIPGVETGDNDE